jgi:hypothetical protein
MERRLRQLGALSGLLALSLGAACDIPTEAPIIDQRWVVPSQTSRISVANLLPAGVSILADSSGFTVSAATASVTRPLSADCAACAAGNGFTGPKPAFTATATMSTSLPVDIGSATLTGGSLVLNVTNNYTFDPLRPNGASAPFGNAVITVTNGSTSLGTTTIDGSTTALNANGGTLSLTIPLAGTISGATPVAVTVTVNSPAGGAVLMDASRTISVTATPTNLKVASANVSVAGRSLSSSTSFDLTGVSSTITDHVLAGAMLLTVVNPFTVTSNLTVTLQPSGGAAIVKNVTLGVGTTTQSIQFTQNEIKALLGHNLSITYTGAATATAGPVNISPKQAVVVTSKLDISLELGS